MEGVLRLEEIGLPREVSGSEELFRDESFYIGPDPQQSLAGNQIDVFGLPRFKLLRQQHHREATTLLFCRKAGNNRVNLCHEGVISTIILYSSRNWNRRDED